MEERRNNDGQEEVKRKRKCVREREPSWVKHEELTILLCIHSKLTTITFNVSIDLSTSCSSNLFVTDDRASLWVEDELCSWLSWIPVSNRQRSLISFCIQTVTMVQILLQSAEGPQTPFSYGDVIATNFGARVLKVSVVECWSINLINPWLAVNQHLHQYLVNSWLTSQPTVSPQSNYFCRHAIKFQ